ncbi:MAG: peptide ABC transporter substrate-binding protein [Chlamydiae bacterium]|nr:peptide ABC transporter substrate-binding protein [Chlamydiota bacterium]
MNFLLLILLLLIGCAHSPPPPSTLNLTIHSYPSTFDPRKSGDFLSSTLICLMFEGLTRPLPDGNVELALAEHFEISQDRCVYTFHLRDAFWSDGHPILAKDFETSWKAIISPTFPSLSPYLLCPIKNGEKCVKGELDPQELGVIALDEKTLQVELEKPTSDFLSLTAFPLFFPIPSHQESFSSTICSGPFRILKSSFNQEILLEKNPHFWNRSFPSFERIRIQVVPDENTAIEMFERGEIDWIGAPYSPIPPDSLALLQNHLRYLPMAASTFIACNTKEFPFQNLNLRKALSLSLDRKSIVKGITYETGIPAFRPIPPSLWKQSLTPLFEVGREEKAKEFFEKALDELKITREHFNTITLYYKSGQVEKKIAQALQRAWEKTLGISLKIEQLDPAIHLQKLHAHDFQLAVSSWIAQIPDPANLLERFRLRTHSKNYSGWENEQYASLIEKTGDLEDPIQRESLLIQAEEILAKELPLIPLYHWTSPTLVSPRLKEMPITKNGAVLFERFTLN